MTAAGLVADPTRCRWPSGRRGGGTTGWGAASLVSVLARRVPTRLFSDAELERLRGFPEITSAELVRYFRLAPGELSGPARRGAGNRPVPSPVCVAVPSGWTAMTPGELRVEKFGFEQPSQPGFVTFGRPAQFNDQQMVKLGTG